MRLGFCGLDDAVDAVCAEHGFAMTMSPLLMRLSNQARIPSRCFSMVRATAFMGSSRERLAQPIHLSKNSSPQALAGCA